MRRTLIAGNWKMNLNRAESVALAQAVVEGADQRTDVELAICPAAVYLDAVAGIVRGSTVRLGAQNVWPEPNGAFTGEISTAMLVDLGCQDVILGHSERRQLCGETDSLVNRKLRAALAAGLRPILCVGETLEERETGRTSTVVRTQILGSLDGVSADEMARVVVAYEPVWAIGTGKVATPAQAEEVHADLRKLLAEQYNFELSESVRILYGGSVKPSNAGELLAQPNIDGALVGGASLKAADFLGIAAGAPR